MAGTRDADAHAGCGVEGKALTDSPLRCPSLRIRGRLQRLYGDCSTPRRSGATPIAPPAACARGSQRRNGGGGSECRPYWRQPRGAPAARPSRRAPARVPAGDVRGTLRDGHEELFDLKLRAIVAGCRNAIGATSALTDARPHVESHGGTIGATAACSLFTACLEHSRHWTVRDRDLDVQLVKTISHGIAGLPTGVLGTGVARWRCRQRARRDPLGAGQRKPDIVGIAGSGFLPAGELGSDLGLDHQRRRAAGLRRGLRHHHARRPGGGGQGGGGDDPPAEIQRPAARRRSTTPRPDLVRPRQLADPGQRHRRRSRSCSATGRKPTDLQAIGNRGH